MSEFTTIKDIPDNIAKELERLHEIIQGPNAVFTTVEKDWARKLISEIHALYFMPKLRISSALAALEQEKV